MTDTRAQWAPRRMTLALAQDVANSASDIAKARGQTISIAVVDDAGHVVLLQRGDGCSYISTETATDRNTNCFRSSRRERGRM